LAQNLAVLRFGGSAVLRGAPLQPCDDFLFKFADIN
jgi:hypothetical protein